MWRPFTDAMQRLEGMDPEAAARAADVYREHTDRQAEALNVMRNLHLERAEELTQQFRHHPRQRKQRNRLAGAANGSERRSDRSTIARQVTAHEQKRVGPRQESQPLTQRDQRGANALQLEGRVRERGLGAPSKSHEGWGADDSPRMRGSRVQEDGLGPPGRSPSDRGDVTAQRLMGRVWEQSRSWELGIGRPGMARPEIGGKTAPQLESRVREKALAPLGPAPSDWGSHASWGQMHEQGLAPPNTGKPDVRANVERVTRGHVHEECPGPPNTRQSEQGAAIVPQLKGQGPGARGEEGGRGPPAVGGARLDGSDKPSVRRREQRGAEQRERHKVDTPSGPPGIVRGRGRVGTVALDSDGEPVLTDRPWLEAGAGRGGADGWSGEYEEEPVVVMGVGPADSTGETLAEAEAEFSAAPEEDAAGAPEGAVGGHQEDALYAHEGAVGTPGFDRLQRLQEEARGGNRSMHEGPLLRRPSGDEKGAWQHRSGWMADPQRWPGQQGGRWRGGPPRKRENFPPRLHQPDEGEGTGRWEMAV